MLVIGAIIAQPLIKNTIELKQTVKTTTAPENTMPVTIQDESKV